MKYLLLFLLPFFFFLGCSKRPAVVSKELPKTYLKKSSFEKLPYWHQENYNKALKAFVKSCQSAKTKKMYPSLCKKAKTTKNAKKFFMKNFVLYAVYDENAKDSGKLTGYYEAQLYGSLHKTEKYQYPVCKTPDDLMVVQLSSIYPELKNIRLRGLQKGNTIVPYYTREKIEKQGCEALCYVDSKIDLFFLEVQGSGRIKLENGKNIYVGYANQNGHQYKSIGKYMVQKGLLKKEEVSLESIENYLKQHPQEVDSILHQNPSKIFFRKKTTSSTGSLGIALTPKRSVAVDPKYIPLGTLLFINSEVDNKNFAHLVLAQDTGGAIKGPIRADLFLGYGKKARKIAGELSSDLEMWVLLPKKGVE